MGRTVAPVVLPVSAADPAACVGLRLIVGRIGCGGCRCQAFIDAAKERRRARRGADRRLIRRLRTARASASCAPQTGALKDERPEQCGVRLGAQRLAVAVASASAA